MHTKNAWWLGYGIFCIVWKRDAKTMMPAKFQGKAKLRSRVRRHPKVATESGKARNADGMLSGNVKACNQA